MLKISVKTDLTGMVRKLDLAQKQAKFAAAMALTKSAKAAQYGLEFEMANVFDRPTSYTMRSLFTKTASPSNLTAEVRMKDEAFKAAPAQVWMRPEVYGGSRMIKRSETLLSSVGILPKGMSIVPGRGAKLDSYGNMSKGQMQKILSGLHARSDKLQNTPMKSATRKGRSKNYDLFVINDRSSHLPMGVYQRKGRAIMMLLAFVKQPKYRKRFDFFGLGARMLRESFPIEFEKAVPYALRTAR